MKMYESANKRRVKQKKKDEQTRMFILLFLWKSEVIEWLPQFHSFRLFVYRVSTLFLFQH